MKKSLTKFLIACVILWFAWPLLQTAWAALAVVIFAVASVGVARRTS